MRSRSAERALRCRDSKRCVKENYFSVWISYKFLISICRAEQAWRLFSSCHLENIMPMCSAWICSELRQLACCKYIHPLRYTILCARWQELHRSRSESPLQSEIKNIPSPPLWIWSTEILFQIFQISYNILLNLTNFGGRPMTKSMQIPEKRIHTVGNHVKTVGTC